MGFTFGRVLVLAAHADDETLGCGGLIHQLTSQRHKSKNGVYVRWACSHSFPHRAQEEVQAHGQAAMRKLGVTNASFLPNLPASRLDTVSLSDVILALTPEIERIRPDTIITHWWNDPHQDHRRVFEAVQVAARAWPGSPSQSVSLLCMEIPSSTPYALSAAFKPNVYVPLRAENIKAKNAAMRCYRSEVQAAPHPRSPSALNALMALRGMESGTPVAEGFLLLRAWGNTG